jgi:hypothetical protein
LGIGKKRKLLRESKISSYAAIIGLSEMPEWLSGDLLLSHWGNDLIEQKKRYAEYVERGLLRELDNPHDKAVAQTVLGTDSFIDKIRRGVVEIAENLNIRRELGEKVQIQHSLHIDKLIEAVSVSCETKKEKLLKKNSRGNEARQILMYLACKHCRGRYTLTQLSTMLGPVTVGALSRSRYNMELKLKNNNNLSERIKKIERLVYIVRS